MPAARDAGTIDDVIAQLDAVIDRSVSDESRLGYFAALYRQVTLAVKHGIHTGFFADPARMEQLDSLLEEFRITRLRKSPSMRLSGGERRRVEIARALATRPSYMLLDEPFAGIDPIAVNDIRALVRHLTQRGIGVLITDHNVRETLDLVGRAYIIHDGTVLTHGTTHEIVNNEDVRRVYLGDQFKI